MLTATILMTLLSSNPTAPSDAEFARRLHDPNRSIFHLPRVDAPASFLPSAHPELEQLRASSAQLRPLRITANTLGTGLLLAAGTIAASHINTSVGRPSDFTANLHLASLITLPLLPLAVTGTGALTGGKGMFLSSMAGTLIGYFSASLLLGFVSHLSASDHYRYPNFGSVTRARVPTNVNIDHRVGFTDRSHVPFLAAAPMLGAVIGYELSSHNRLSAPMGPNHPVLPLAPRTIGTRVSFEF